VWGDLHRAEPRHPLARLLGHEGTSAGPAPRGGSGDTVGSTPYTPDFRQAGGATFRLVIDVGAWDESVAMNSPGQSGVPVSPHHHDLFESWAADEAFPLLYSREAVERNLGDRLVLRPRVSR
jgi:penicillin amidase